METNSLSTLSPSLRKTMLFKRTIFIPNLCWMVFGLTEDVLHTSTLAAREGKYVK